MNYSPGNILRKLLVDAGVGTLRSVAPAGNWPIFTTRLPDLIDQAIQISDSAGLTDGRIMRSGQVIVHPGIHILVRDLSDVTSYNKIYTIEAVVDAVYRNNVVFSDATYQVQSVTRSSNIIPLGWEDQEMEIERKRFIHSLNVRMTYTKTAG